MPNRLAQTRLTLRVPARQRLFDDAHPSRYARVLPSLGFSGAALARFRRRMPFCADLLGVRIDRDRNARSCARHGTRDLAASALPSIQPRGSRFRAARTTRNASAARTITIEGAAPFR